MNFMKIENDNKNGFFCNLNEVAEKVKNDA